MRLITVFACTSIVAIIVAGCSAIPATQPAITIPVDLDDQAFSATSSSGIFSRQAIDLTTSEQWQQHADHISGVETLSLTMSVSKALGETSAHLNYYVSDCGDMTSEALRSAEPLLKSTLPGTLQNLQYDSGYVLLSPAAERIINDGHFYLYATGGSQTLSIHATHTQMHVKLRVSFL